MGGGPKGLKRRREKKYLCVCVCMALARGRDFAIGGLVIKTQCFTMK